ncbi:hypothetical protein T439DRAFT_377588 [Meredithblackwellia eburnea MCA 4105]
MSHNLHKQGESRGPGINPTGFSFSSSDAFDHQLPHGSESNPAQHGVRRTADSSDDAYTSKRHQLFHPLDPYSNRPPPKNRFDTDRELLKANFSMASPIGSAAAAFAAQSSGSLSGSQGTRGPVYTAYEQQLLAKPKPAKKQIHQAYQEAFGAAFFDTGAQPSHGGPGASASSSSTAPGHRGSSAIDPNPPQHSLSVHPKYFPERRKAEVNQLRVWRNNW